MAMPSQSEKISSPFSFNNAVSGVVSGRFEMAAQRSVNIDDLSQYTPYQVTQALRSEAIEALKGMQGASPYLNLHDVTSSEEQPEAPKQIIDSTARPPESRPDEQAPKKPKGRSRLDPD